MVPEGEDRVFNGTEDDEMAMVIPADKVNEILEGLEAARIATYLIPKHIRREPRFPQNYKISYCDYI